MLLPACRRKEHFKEWGPFTWSSLGLGRHSCTLTPHPIPAWFWPVTAMGARRER